MIVSAESRSGGSVPILEYDFPAGKMVAAGASPASADIDAGAYLIVSDAPCYLKITTRTGGTSAAAAAGSLFLAAGVPLHILVDGKDKRLSVIAKEDAGSVFVIPAAAG